MHACACVNTRVYCSSHPQILCCSMPVALWAEDACSAWAQWLGGPIWAQCHWVPCSGTQMGVSRVPSPSGKEDIGEFRKKAVLCHLKRLALGGGGRQCPAG